MPAFEPQLPDEYADLTVDEEQPDEEAPAHEKFRLPAGVRVFAYVCCVLAASVRWPSARGAARTICSR